VASRELAALAALFGRLGVTIEGTVGIAARHGRRSRSVETE
jgi:hypothetical protein